MYEVEAERFGEESRPSRTRGLKQDYNGDQMRKESRVPRGRVD